MQTRTSTPAPRPQSIRLTPAFLQNKTQTRARRAANLIQSFRMLNRLRSRSRRFGVASNLELPSLDVALELVEARALGNTLPGRTAGIEDLVHFLKSLALGLGSCTFKLAK